MKKKIILAYSGGLDTSIAIPWLKEKYAYDVIALIADLGGNNLHIEDLKQKALNAGALRCYAPDVQKDFALNYLSHALKANALYEGVYPLISALSRPLIASLLVDYAQKEGAVAVAHGCTGKGNDQVRLDVSIRALNPHLTIVSPAREAPMSREEAISYAIKHDIPVENDHKNPFSIDLNIWGRSCECGILENPWTEAPEDAFALTTSVNNYPSEPEELIISFEKGLPTSCNKEKMDFHELIIHLNTIAGRQGVGRIDHVENRLVGIKSREVYEAPAATVLIQAHRALETICLPRQLAHFKPFIEAKFAHLIYNGLWYSPLFNALNAFIDESSSHVSGDVRIRLHQGKTTVVGRRSDFSLYRYDLATYNPDDAFDHSAAEGFVKMWGLPTETYAFVRKQE